MKNFEEVNRRGSHQISLNCLFTVSGLEASFLVFSPETPVRDNREPRIDRRESVELREIDKILSSLLEWFLDMLTKRNDNLTRLNYFFRYVNYCKDTSVHSLLHFLLVDG